jgi:hypothetical protein
VVAVLEGAVAIDAAHTGVTDGKAATQLSTYVPRSMSSCIVGALPVATAAPRARWA